MVEYATQLDHVFGSLADPTRRDILARVAGVERSVSELAEKYEVSFAAIAKHVKVLEAAGLIIKRKEGRQQLVSLSPAALQEADEYLAQYRRVWQGRFNKLESLLDNTS